MKDKSKILAIVLVIITILVVILSSIYDNNKKQENDINIVTNYSNFYTVSSCIYRTMTYVESKDNNSLYLIVSDDYKKKNKIEKSNVIDLFPTLELNSTFVPKKMYYEILNDNITKYYVYGYVEKEELYEDGQINTSDKLDIYFIVYLDSNNKTFSLEPYSGEIFIGGDIDE